MTNLTMLNQTLIVLVKFFCSKYTKVVVVNTGLTVFLVDFCHFLIVCHFFEVAGAVVKIGSILKPKKTPLEI